MLELRPNCENCDCDLAPESTQACICTYECTFCRECVDGVLFNVCPNCGGGFEARPIRPKDARREGLSTQHHSPSKKRVHTELSPTEIAEFANTHKDIKPEDR